MITITEVRPLKVGFRGSDVMRSMSRGRVHDPDQVRAVEVSVWAPTRAELEDHAAREAILHVARRYKVTASRVAKRNPFQARDGWRCSFEVD